MFALRATLLTIAMLGLLVGCGQPTPYQPAVQGFGYAEQQIEANRYRVTFAGNDLTPSETVQNYVLYRAAEVTLDQGYDYFTMVDRNLDRSTAYWGSGDTAFSSGYATRSGGVVGGIGTTLYTARPIDSYTASADIVLFQGEKPLGEVDAYDARDVLRRLDPTIAAAPGVMRITPEAQ